MLERYSIFSKTDKLEQHFGVEIPESYSPVYNAAPSQLLPVISNASPKGFSFFYWGLSPNWTKNKTVSKKLINCDKENITNKVSSRNCLGSRRCIVPADSYFNWKNIGKKSKIPYRILLKSETPIGMAGLWDEFEDEGGKIYHTFSIITVTANDLLEEIQDRMPAILRPEQYEPWLNEDGESEHLQLLETQTADNFHFYPVSHFVNSLHINTAQVIQPSQPVDQYGNYTLFN